MDLAHDMSNNAGLLEYLVMNGMKIFCSNSQNVHDTRDEESEEVLLRREEFVHKNLYKCILYLMSPLREWYDSDEYEDKHKGIAICSIMDQLLDELKQLAELLKNQDSRRFFMLLINRTIGPLKCKEELLVRKFGHEYLNYLISCEKRDKKKCAPSMRVTVSSTNYQEHQFPLKLSAVDSSGKQIANIENSIIVNQEKYKLEEKTQQFYLENSVNNVVDLRLSSVKNIRFFDCYSIEFLDISHTLICHLDARQLVALEGLRLMNTNVRRLNLVGQGGLRFLYCSYTPLDYLRLLGHPRLRILHAECSGRVKLSGTSARCKVFTDGGQTVDAYQCEGREEKRMGSYVISCPENQETEQIEIAFPGKCNELIDSSIKQCKEVGIYCFERHVESTIDFVNIINYPNLEKLDVWHIRCRQFRICNIPELADIVICCLEISNIFILDFPNLRKIRISECYCLKQINIENCKRVETLDVSYTKVSELDITELKQLRGLNINNASISELDLFFNTELEDVNVSNTEIFELHISELMGLKRLNACGVRISQIDVSKNKQLIELDIHETELTEISVMELLALKKLYIFGTAISEIDVSTNINLEELYVFGTAIAELSVCNNRKLRELYINDTKIFELDISQLTELKVLKAFNTSISEIDLSRNTKLECLEISNTKLSWLDVGQLVDLESLWAENTIIHEINVSRNTKIKVLGVSNTKLYELDVGRLAELSVLCIERTNISYIDLENNKELTWVGVSSACKVMNCCCRVHTKD